MSSDKPLLVVLGPTGTQGGSVLRHFLSLSPSPYTLRGVTQDLSSPKSVFLASLGVEMVAGDFDHPPSLDAAFKDAHVIFSVTEFWPTFADPTRREKAAAADQSIGVYAREYEAQQNRNIIDAAAKVGTLERFIVSSLPNSTKLSEGKYSHIYHFDGKAMAVEYGQSKYPKLWEKTSVFYGGFYLENYIGPVGALFGPKMSKDRSTLILHAAEPLSTVHLPMYSATDDTGALVHSLIRAAPGKTLIGVNEWLTLQDFTNTLAEVLGKKVEFVEQNPSFDTGDADLAQDRMEMLGFCIEFGYDGGKVDKNVVKPAELGVPVRIESVKEWCRKQDWETVLQVSD